MPRKEIDYSKTIIYKIQHQDLLELLYIGHTTDFVKRKSQHRICVYMESSRKYNYRLYKMIRENGGWESFSMIQVKEFSCSNSREASAEEDKCMTELKATLNARRAHVDLSVDEYMKNYRLNHKEEKRLLDKNYRDLNKDYIKAYKSKPHNCECGKVICHDEISRHKKSKHHINFMSETQESHQPSI
jgi:hypothetical protein